MLGDEFLKLFSEEELERMDKSFLIERNFLLEDQIKIRIEREESFQKVIGSMIEMIQLERDALTILLGKYQFDLADDPELIQKLETNETRFHELATFIYDNHCNKNVAESFNNKINYLKSEWL